MPTPRPSRPTTPARPSEPSARGFVLLTVMVLIFVATLMVGWGLKRATMQSRIADIRIEDYRLHHERLGLIALGERWMRQESPESLIKESQGSAASYVATLPDDTEISIHVEDGQDLLLSRVELSDPVVKQFLLDALTRIPPGESSLIRSVGPAPVSLRDADDMVLEAIAGDDDKALGFMKKCRDDPPDDDNKLKLEINRADFEDVMTNRLTQLLTVKPTLWRLLADVRDEHGSRRYEILIEFQGNQPKTHSCRIIPTTDEKAPKRKRRSR